MCFLFVHDDDDDDDDAIRTTELSCVLRVTELDNTELCLTEPFWIVRNWRAVQRVSFSL